MVVCVGIYYPFTTSSITFFCLWQKRPNIHTVFKNNIVIEGLQYKVHFHRMKLGLWLPIAISDEQGRFA